MPPTKKRYLAVEAAFVRMKKLLNNFFGLKMLCDGSKKEAIWLWLALSVWFPFVLSGVVIAICFFVIILSPDSRAVITKQKRMLALACAIGGLSFVSAATVGNLIGMAIAFGVLVELICGCYLRGTAERESFNKATAILGYGSVAACIVAIIQHEVIYRNPDYRPTAGAFNANYYGALIVFTLIMVAIRFMEKDPESGDALKWYHLPKWVWLGFGIVNLFALLYCRSRSSLLALMACAFVYLVLSRRWILTVICTACFAGVWLLGFYRPDLFDWQNSLSFIFEQRVGIWISAWEAYLDSFRSILIGRGPMAYLFAHVSEAMHAHNVLFDTLINVGIVGLALYVLLILDILRESWRNMKQGGREWLVSVTIVAEILIQGVFDVTIMWIQTGIMFLLLVFPIAKKTDDIGRSISDS